MTVQPALYEELVEEIARLRTTVNDQAATITALFREIEQLQERLRVVLKHVADTRMLAKPEHPSNLADRPAGGGPTSTGGPHQRKGNRP